MNARVIDVINLVGKPAIEKVIKAAQEAQNASLGDSNDEEIDLLREALDEALGVLGLSLPDPEEQDEEN